MKYHGFIVLLLIGVAASLPHGHVNEDEVPETVDIDSRGLFGNIFGAIGNTLGTIGKGVTDLAGGIVQGVSNILVGDGGQSLGVALPGFNYNARGQVNINGQLIGQAVDSNGNVITNLSGLILTSGGYLINRNSDVVGRIRASSGQLVSGINIKADGTIELTTGRTIGGLAGLAGTILDTAVGTVFNVVGNAGNLVKLTLNSAGQLVNEAGQVVVESAKKIGEILSGILTGGGRATANVGIVIPGTNIGADGKLYLNGQFIGTPVTLTGQPITDLANLSVTSLGFLLDQNGQIVGRLRNNAGQLITSITVGANGAISFQFGGQGASGLLSGLVGTVFNIVDDAGKIVQVKVDEAGNLVDLAGNVVVQAANVTQELFNKLVGGGDSGGVGVPITIPGLSIVGGKLVGAGGMVLGQAVDAAGNLLTDFTGLSLTTTGKIVNGLSQVVGQLFRDGKAVTGISLTGGGGISITFGGSAGTGGTTGGTTGGSTSGGGFLSNTLGAIGQGVGDLAGGIVQGVSGVLNELVKGVVGSVINVTNAAGQTIKGTIDAGLNIVDAAGNTILKAGEVTVGSVLNVVGDLVRNLAGAKVNVVNSAGQVITGTLTAAGNVVDGAGNVLVQAANVSLDVLKNLAAGLSASINVSGGINGGSTGGGFIGNTLGAVGNLAGGIVQGVSGALNELVKGVVGSVINVTNAAGQTIQGTFDAGFNIVDAAGNTILRAGQITVGSVLNLVGDLVRNLAGAKVNVVNAAGQVITGTLTAAGNVVDGAGNVLVQAGNVSLDVLKNLAAGLSASINVSV